MIRLVRKIMAVLTPRERGRMLLLTVMDTVSSVADIAGLALLLWVIQLYAGAGFAGAAPGAGRGVALWPIGLFFLLFGIKNWLSFLIYSAQARLRYGVASRISRQNLLYYLEGEYNEYAHT